MVVGLSGGVDSSVAAALLLEHGYEVEGVYLECYNVSGCRTDQDKSDALKVAIKLGIKFQVLDFRKEYREKVIEYFYREYEVGRTPNPDIVCNREIKFGIFYDYAMEHGYDYVATGHYCRILQGSVPCDNQLQGTEPCNWLQRARDESKDQSYFLWQVPRDHLSHILFPIGAMLKSEVRAKAKQLGLHTASKPDSMGICFIGEVDVNELLKKRLGEKEGEVVLKIQNPKSKILNKSQIQNHKFKTVCDLKFAALNLEDDYIVIGRHRGLWFYTIGSRGGFTMNAKMQKADMEPLYVIGKDKERNQLIVGTREQTMTNKFRIDSSTTVGMTQRLWVRIRNLGELVKVEKIDGDLVVLKDKIFGVASGQSAVFYDERGVLVDGSIIV